MCIRDRLSSALIKEIPENQPLIFLTSDHLIEKTNLFNKSIKKHQKYLTDKNPLNFLWIGFIKLIFPNSKVTYGVIEHLSFNSNIIGERKIEIYRPINSPIDDQTIFIFMQD